MRSVFKHNFQKPLRRLQNVQRVYALQDEQGLALCTSAEGKSTGAAVHLLRRSLDRLEYQVAAHLIYEGLVEEGLQIVRAVRHRHDGRRRNPWDEFEYGRSLRPRVGELVAHSGLERGALQRGGKVVNLRPQTAGSLPLRLRGGQRLGKAFGRQEQSATRSSLWTAQAADLRPGRRAPNLGERTRPGPRRVAFDQNRPLGLFSYFAGSRRRARRALRPAILKSRPRQMKFPSQILD